MVGPSPLWTEGAQVTGTHFMEDRPTADESFILICERPGQQDHQDNSELEGSSANTSRKLAAGAAHSHEGGQRQVQQR